MRHDAPNKRKTSRGAYDDQKKHPPAKAAEPSRGKRLFRINSLIDAIANCEWEDAEHVIGAYVDEARAGFPPLHPNDILSKNDVAFCSEQISFEDLRAYYIGCGIKEIRERVNEAVNDGAQAVTISGTAET